ncbi:MAG: phosphonate ABC transporter, permease protein PhnE [Anaerolineales bacterium]
MHEPLTPGRITRNVLLLVLLFLALSVSWRVTEIDLGRLIRDLPKGGPLVRAFLTPDVFTRDVETSVIGIDFPVPCGSAQAALPPTAGPRLLPSVPCAAPGETFILEGKELPPQSEILIRWQLPDGRTLNALRVQTDARGEFSAQVQARPILTTQNGKPAQLQTEIRQPVGMLKPSQALKDVVREIFITIFMALLSTTIATIIAAPLSFLAASNITRRGCFGSAIYYLSRSFFNIIRSYDPLVMATVFAFWLGYGPFAGVLALTVVTIASLGKLFSEAVESIDAGPIEALQAAGANRLQTVRYAVIPQIVPDFISFIIYHWDINVRISTIIGYVGGGGIGFYLSQRINGFEYNQAGTALWAIVIVVWAMDFLSAEVRKRVT